VHVNVAAEEKRVGSSNTYAVDIYELIFGTENILSAAGTVTNRSPLMWQMTGAEKHRGMKGLYRHQSAWSPANDGPHHGWLGWVRR
jgi:hypothetical protein